MAKLGISTGTTPNDGTGDNLLAGAVKINSNFNEIYTRFGDGTNLTSIGGTWTSTSVGIHTLKNVGIGTTNPTSALTVTGNGTFTGVVTATTFVGALTGTATSTTNIPNLVGNIVSIGNNTSLGSITSAALRTALTSSTGTGDAVFATSPTFTTPTLGTPASGILSNCTFPTLNQNTSGTAAGLTGTPNITVGVVTASRLNVGTGGTVITTTTAGLVGIGTTNPTSALTVKGNTSLETLNVSGISTLGTLQISSGIVTATSGIVTYYGDASYTASGRWTLGASGNNDYTFTGIGFTQTTSDPVLYLVRGRVYEFVNNSVGSHPFQIRVSNGGSAYSDGVTNNAAASGVIRFEVPFNAPNTLYYQCTNHSGMGATIFVTPRNEPAVGVRTTVTATTSSIGAGATSNLNIDGFKTYSLLKVGISSAAWVVLYTDSTSRSNDASRSYLTDPTPGSGVIAEVRTVSSGISTFIMSPGVIGWNNDVSVASTIYARVTNNESSTSTGIGVTLTVVKLED